VKLKKTEKDRKQVRKKTKERKLKPSPNSLPPIPKGFDALQHRKKKKKGKSRLSLSNSLPLSFPLSLSLSLSLPLSLFLSLSLSLSLYTQPNMSLRLTLCKRLTLSLISPSPPLHSSFLSRRKRKRGEQRETKRERKAKVVHGLYIVPCRNSFLSRWCAGGGKKGQGGQIQDGGGTTQRTEGRGKAGRGKYEARPKRALGRQGKGVSRRERQENETYTEK
jgi:hypothetical protein